MPTLVYTASTLPNSARARRRASSSEKPVGAAPSRTFDMGQHLVLHPALEPSRCALAVSTNAAAHAGSYVLRRRLEREADGIGQAVPVASSSLNRRRPAVVTGSASPFACCSLTPLRVDDSLVLEAVESAG